MKDENNDEPTVQARQHNNNNNNHNNGMGSTTVHAHKVPAHVSPFELGMYTLLAALCFAIVAFVVSCVVYASKYKQNSLDMPTTTLMSECERPRVHRCLAGRSVLKSFESFSISAVVRRTVYHVKSRCSEIVHGRW